MKKINKNQSLIIVLFVSIAGWIFSDYVRSSKLEESGVVLATCELGDKTTVIEMKQLMKVKTVVESLKFSYGSTPSVELALEEFLKKETQETQIAFFVNGIVFGPLFSNNELYWEIMYLENGVRYYTTFIEELDIPKVSKMKSIRYLGDGKILVEHELDSSKISKTGWYGFLRFVFSIMIVVCLFFLLLKNTKPAFGFGKDDSGNPVVGKGWINF